MKHGLWRLVAGGLASFEGLGHRRGAHARVQRRTVHVGADAYDFQLFIPAKLAGQKNLPLIIFLHGIGQRGTGGFVPTAGARGALVQHYLEKIPAIILLPQCREGSYWSDSLMDRMVMAALAQTICEFGADPSRVYLTGVSMGGYGVWHLASQHPQQFAALVSICGGSPLRHGERFAPIAAKIGETPVWVFHGADDRVVPVSESRQMVSALKAHHEGVRYSEYVGVGHQVWMNVLGEDELLPWLLQQRLSAEPQK
jgi:predicted peptidase